MTTARILLTGIRADGRHGANPGERDAPQAFAVDLDVLIDMGDDDELEDTVDYRVLVDAARGVVEGGSFVLLESLADAVARALFGLEHVQRVVATVHKPGAAANLGLVDVAAEATAG